MLSVPARRLSGERLCGQPCVVSASEQHAG
jgi:hypothetical protein